MFTVSNAFLISSDTVIMRYGGLFWLKPVAMVFIIIIISLFVHVVNIFNGTFQKHKYTVIS